MNSQYFKENSRIWRERKQALGLCSRCGRDKIVKNRSKCKECLRVCAIKQKMYNDLHRK